MVDQTKNRNDVSKSNQRGSSEHDTRVEAGKKAAATRGHESLSEAGRKGGEQSHGGGREKTSGSKKESEE